MPQDAARPGDEPSEGWWAATLSSAHQRSHGWVRKMQAMNESRWGRNRLCNSSLQGILFCGRAGPLGGGQNGQRWPHPGLRGRATRWPKNCNRWANRQLCLPRGWGAGAAQGGPLTMHSAALRDADLKRIGLFMDSAEFRRPARMQPHQRDSSLNSIAFEQRSY